MLCQEKHIPINAVDDREYCTFLFPSLVQRGQLTIGISTAGASPTAARWMRERITDIIPEQFDRILDYLEQIRPVIKQQIPGESLRGMIFKELFTACMEKGAPLDSEETAWFLQNSNAVHNH